MEKPTVKLLIALHNNAMALNSIPGLDGNACQKIIDVFWDVAEKLAPLGWVQPDYWDNNQHIPDLKNTDIWGQFDENITLRPATELDILAINLADVALYIEDSKECEACGNMGGSPEGDGCCPYCHR